MARETKPLRHQGLSRSVADFLLSATLLKVYGFVMESLLLCGNIRTSQDATQELS